MWALNNTLITKLIQKQPKYLPQLSTTRAHRSYVDWTNSLKKNNRTTGHNMVEYTPKITPEPPSKTPNNTSTSPKPYRLEKDSKYKGKIWMQSNK